MDIVRIYENSIFVLHTFGEKTELVYYVGSWEPCHLGVSKDFNWILIFLFPYAFVISYFFNDFFYYLINAYLEALLEHLSKKKKIQV